MNSKRECGLYYIDEEYRLLHFNEILKERHSDIEAGQRCYRAIAGRDEPCPHCPLKAESKHQTFIDRNGSLMHIQAAGVELPMLGRCYSVTFSELELAEREHAKKLQDEMLDSISCGVYAYTLPDHRLLIVNNAAKKIIGCGENDDPMQSPRSFLTDRVLSMQNQLADSLGNGIFAYTVPERRVLMLNQEARDMLDFHNRDESEYGTWITKKVLESEKDSVKDTVRVLREPGDSVDYIFHYDAENGERRAYKCKTKLLSFEDGQKFILSAITDITEQERREQHIDEERTIFRNALNYGSSGFFDVELSSGILKHPIISRNGEDVTKRLGISIPTSYDELAAVWFDENRIACVSSDIEKFRSCDRLIECCREGTSIIDIEYRVIEENRFYHIIVLLYELDGRVLASFIIHDVSSDRYEEQQRRAIIDSLGNIYSALYHFSLNGEKCRLLKVHSDVKLDLDTNFSYMDFYEQYTSKYISVEYYQAVREFLFPDNIREALKNDEFTSIEFIHAKLGWCRITLVASERDRLGNVISVVFAGNVIEKQKQKELVQQEALRAACESANIANSAKTDFLANMSHDIRTPMNAIIGMTAIAAANIDDRERVADCLSKIGVSSKHLLGIINEVLDMSKIESGKMELQDNDFNLLELIDDLLTMSKPSVNAKHHELAVDLKNISHENVTGDSQRIQQVFMNLMNNAIKYTPDGGRIELEISEKSTNKPKIGCYEFIFSDNGIGMDEEFIKHIFEPFTRATDDPRLDNIQGTGLGMSITQNIIHMMNGNISVESELNVGTKITVEIFLKLQNNEDIHRSEDIRSGSSGELDDIANVDFSGRRALLVEDNSLNAEIAGEILGMAGLEVEFATNGRDAVNIMSQAENGYFSIIFMDIQMPLMNGYEAARAIRELPGDYAKSVPIIAMTANAFVEDVAAAKNAGMNEHIAKPLDFDQLLKALKKWLI